MDYTLHLSNTSHTNHPQVRGHFGGFVSPISSSTSNTSNSNINNNVNNPSNMMGGKKRVRSDNRMNLVDNNNDDKFKLISSLSLASSSPLMDCDEQQFSLNEELDEENMVNYLIKINYE
ncbi:8937_t:CDS:2 [Entrophospora sp. SA101]|nr:8937_t:CDS:2 [Entrophospora sp. SA101]